MPKRRRKEILDFDTQAWLNEPRLRNCSLAARGVWAEMLFLMHNREPYGHLVRMDGTKMLPADLAREIKAKHADVDVALDELRRNGVFSVTDDGIIYSRRMVRDARFREKQTSNARKSTGNPLLKRISLVTGKAETVEAGDETAVVEPSPEVTSNKVWDNPVGYPSGITQWDNPNDKSGITQWDNPDSQPPVESEVSDDTGSTGGTETPTKGKGKALEDRSSEEDRGGAGGKEEPTPAPTAKQRKPREGDATRIPLPFPFGDGLQAWAGTKGMTEEFIRWELEKFENFWKAKPGVAGKKLDWEATCRTWLMNAWERDHAKWTKGPGPRTTPGQQRLDMPAKKGDAEPARDSHDYYSADAIEARRKKREGGGSEH